MPPAAGSAEKYLSRRGALFTFFFCALKKERKKRPAILETQTMLEVYLAEGSP